MFFSKNLIKVKKWDWLQEVIVRKTKYYLYLLLLFFVFYIVVTSFIVYWWYIFVTQNNNKLIDYITTTLVLLCVTIMRMVILSLLIRYFYNVLIINDSRIVKITFGIFFISNIKMIEIYRVQTVISKQSWIRKTLLNYGHIVAKIQSWWATNNLQFKYISKPNEIALLIEKMKEKSQEKRFFNETKELP